MCFNNLAEALLTEIQTENQELRSEYRHHCEHRVAIEPMFVATYERYARENVTQ